MTECGVDAFDVLFQCIDEYVRIKTAINETSGWLTPHLVLESHVAIKRGCTDILDAMNCEAALSFCNTQIGSAFWATSQGALQ